MVEVAVRSWNGLTIPAPGHYLLDDAHTRIGFHAVHMMVSPVRGEFTRAAAAISVAEDPLQSDVAAVIEAASITTGHDERDAHLRSPDFLDVERYPALTYRSTRMRRYDDDPIFRWARLRGLARNGPVGDPLTVPRQSRRIAQKFLLAGELTIKGITRPVELDVAYGGAHRDPDGRNIFGFNATAEIDRTDYGLVWNVPLENRGVLVGRRGGPHRAGRRGGPPARLTRRASHPGRGGAIRTLHPSATSTVTAERRRRIGPHDDFCARRRTYPSSGRPFPSSPGSTVPDARMLEIANEQRFVDRVYERVEVTRTQARALAREGHERAAAGPVSRLVERDAMVFHAAERVRTLDAESEGLVFGRLDFDDGETYHIGRLGLRDENREALLVDWRAPAAAAFYRATPGEPLGVVRRRVIICRGPEVVDLDDDLLAPDGATDLPVLGEGALLAALRRSRGPHMRDIVTTIQREQDEAIRAPVRGVTLITGGPGTGKTQVALHRAAYLLYTDRGRFADGRVLVVGPSTVFTSYIGRVLPALGEDSVHLRAIGELVDGVTATRHDPAPVAEIKGSDRMRSVLVELMWQAPPAAPDRLRLVYAGQVLTLDATALARARRRVRARADDTGTPPNAARGIAAATVLDTLWTRVAGAHRDRDDFIEEVGDRPEFQRFLHAWWPRLSPPQVLSWLRDAARARPVLGAGPAGTLAASYEGHPDWSVEDVPLLDELAELLGEPPALPKASPDGSGWRLRELTAGPRRLDTFVLSCRLQDGWSLYAPGHPTPIALAGPEIDNDAVVAAWRWAEAVIRREGHRVVSWQEGLDPYGEEGYVPVLAEPLPAPEPEDESPDGVDYAHVILDEAQDLSPMEARMIARRAAFASMTIVGDLGQATHPLAVGSWPELLARLGRRDWRALELRTGYRVPRVIADYAARLLPPGIAATRSYRPGGLLSVRHVDDLHAAVNEAVREAPGDGTVAVIAADQTAAALAPLVDGATVVPASLVKGLEYDHVIVLEPAEILAAEPRGRSRLYVVLTRAVAGLVVLHRAPLPAALRR